MTVTGSWLKLLPFWFTFSACLHVCCFSNADSNLNLCPTIGEQRSNFPHQALCLEAKCLLHLSAGLEVHPAARFTHPVEENYYSDNLRLRCGIGFRLVGCTEVQCATNGWECLSNDGNSFPHCVPSTGLCPPIPEFVRGGSWRLASLHPLDHFAPGDLATLTCRRPWFIEDGNPQSTISCKLDEQSGNAQWSLSKLPSCRPVTCPPIIPASLPSGVIVRDWKQSTIMTPIFGPSESVFQGSEIGFDCVKRPRQPRKPTQQELEVAMAKSRDPNGCDGNWTWLPLNVDVDLTPGAIWRFGQPSTAKIPKELQLPFSIGCSSRKRWSKLSEEVESSILPTCERDDGIRSSFVAAMPNEMQSAVLPHRLSVIESNLLPNCASVAYSEVANNFNELSLCPPLPFFSDPRIPGWLERFKRFPSNSIPIHFNATLDCGRFFWPESASTDTDHTAAPTAECVPFFGTAMAELESIDDPLYRVGAIGRWVFRHGDGSKWTGSIPPTCVPRPSCGALPTYSGWRLASGLPPHQFYAGDQATCSSIAVADDGSQVVTKSFAITCSVLKDGSQNVQHEPQLSSSLELSCPEVTCPAPGGYPLAYRVAQHHTNFIGRINLQSLVDNSVKLDYFAPGDSLHYRCIFRESGFRLKCSANGRWVMEGVPCV